MPAGAPGVVLHDDWDALGMRASGSQSVSFEGVELPAAALRGGFPAGDARAYMEVYGSAGLFHAAASLGIAEASARGATAAARRFGVPGARGRMLLAENAVDLSAARATLSRAAPLLDAHDGPDADAVALFGEAQAAKAFVGQAAERVVARALELSGGAGYLNGHPLARAYRDVKAGVVHAPARRQPRLRPDRRPRARARAGAALMRPCPPPARRRGAGAAASTPRASARRSAASPPASRSSPPTRGGSPLGLVVSSLASVSLRPPLVSFCPSRDSFTWSRMRRAGRFGVNVLGESHADYVRAAAPAGADRFAGRRVVAHRLAACRGSTDAIAFLECAIEAEHRAGDHWIVVGRVERALTAPGLPLLTWASDLARLEPLEPDGDPMTLRILARRGRATAALGLTALALSAGAALAATAGDLDPSFDDDGRLVLPFKITPGDVLPQSDGKVLVTDEDSATVVRLNADGSLDRGFGGDGIVTDFVDVPVGAAALQPDGKLVVAGATARRATSQSRASTRTARWTRSFGAGRARRGRPEGLHGPAALSTRTRWSCSPTAGSRSPAVAPPASTVSRLEPDGKPDGTSFEYFDRSYVARGGAGSGRQDRRHRLHRDVRHDRLRPRGRALQGRRPARHVARRHGPRAVRPQGPRRRAGRRGRPARPQDRHRRGRPARPRGT